MTRHEFTAITRALSDGWRRSLTAAEADLFFEELAEFPVDVVLVAMRVIYRQGGSTAPTAGAIRRRIVDLTLSAPPWMDVWREVLAYSKAGALSGPYANDHRKRLADRRQGMHPLVRTFIERVGNEQVAALVDKRGGEANLREKWEAHVSSARDAMLLGGLPGLAVGERAALPA